MLWTVYMVECSDGSLYTGVTTDPIRRLARHNEGRGAKYTASRLPVRQVWAETGHTRETALRREFAIKRLSRSEKLELVGKIAKNWPVVVGGD